MSAPEDGSSQPLDPSGEPFDPYRFGKPDYYVPPEFAPPGYVSPPPPTAPPLPVTPYAGGGEAPHSTPYPAYAPNQLNQYPQAYQGLPPPQYTAGRSTSGKATAALVLGIGSILLFWLSIFDLIVVVLALIFGFISLGETRSGQRAGRGMAVGGLICAFVGAALAIVTTVLVVHAINKCGGIDERNSPGFNQCVRDHLG